MRELQKNGNGVACNGDGSATEVVKQKMTRDAENNGASLSDQQTPGKRLKTSHRTRMITPDSNCDFLREIVEVIIKDGLCGAMDRKNKVCEWKSPEELSALFPDLSITEEGASKEQLISMTQDVIKYSVKTTNPRFFNQLFGGMDQYSLSGAWVTEALNTSQYTFEVAPVFTLMEKEVYQKMLGLIGFDKGEAIFTPGGSVANLYGMNVARFVKFPDVKTKGVFSLPKPLCLFTSEKAHYSMKKSAAVLGLGTDCIFTVKADECGRMMPSDLREKIKTSIAEGYEPFFVNGTAGTTVMGAYDPLDQIAEVCQEFNLWLHVDGAWGGSVAASKTYRHLLKGIEKADSMTWNPHKMMGAPLQCAMFLTKHKDILKKCHCANAAYLFQQDKHYDTSYDTGDMSLQCGRKVDVMKLWMLWKGKGDSGMERDIDHLFDLSRYLASKVKQTKGFRLLFEPQCTNVCFYYVPPSLRGQEETPDWWDKLSKVAPVIKERMMKNGSLMIGYQPDGKFVNFFRMILSNMDTTTDDLDFLVQEIDKLGCDL